MGNKIYIYTFKLIRFKLFTLCKQIYRLKLPILLPLNVKFENNKYKPVQGTYYTIDGRLQYPLPLVY